MDRPESVPTQETTVAEREQTPVSPSIPRLTTFGEEFRLTCPICLKDLQKPKQLKTCFHIFCADCLRPFIEQSQDHRIVCPVCNTWCPVEDISKAMNSDNYLHTLQGLVCLCAESGNIYCNVHPEIFACYFCLECGKNFCDPCHDDDHNVNEDFSSHHCLKLFKSKGTMTVGMNRRESGVGTPTYDDLDTGSRVCQCPVCRTSDECDHKLWLNHLHQEAFLTNDECPIPEHADGNKLIAFCTYRKCQKPICRNCSMIEHRDHETVDIRTAMKDNEIELKAIKKFLSFQHDIFDAAAKQADKAERLFKNHVHHVEEEMIERKGKVQMQVEEAFNIAYNLIEQTGQKQAELNRQSIEMHQENNFIKAAINLADKIGDDPNPLEFIRIWKGLDCICSGLRGEDDKSTEEPEVVLPQEIMEKMLVLPASNCMYPDLRILKKVGVEGKVLSKAFVLKAESELLLFYSILPLTGTEALVSCKTESFITSLVQYSNLTDMRHKIYLKEDGQYCFIAVPGNGIVATLYQSPGMRPQQKSAGKKQVLFWDQALDRSLKEHEAEGVGDKLKSFAETPLPPRGVTVTNDNHLVVLTAKDPKDADGEGGSACIMIMTMRGDVLRSKILTPATVGSQHGHYFPRYVTVNINGDICVTNEKDRSIVIFNSDLQELHHIRNPYSEGRKNEHFSPMGICHDSFGRLIVADNYNHCVIRFDVEAVKQEAAQVIVENKFQGVEDLNFPTMVALGPGPRLWVVCRDNIQVFDYMDKE